MSNNDVCAKCGFKLADHSYTSDMCRENYDGEPGAYIENQHFEKKVYKYIVLADGHRVVCCGDNIICESIAEAKQTIDLLQPDWPATKYTIHQLSEPKE